MKRENDELKIDLSISDAELFEETFAGFEENAEVTDAEKKRVLSSVMRKAGFEMNGIISENRKNITAATKNDPTVRRGSIQVKRGGVIAACIAVLAVGAVTAGILRNNNINADIPEPASRSSVDGYATDAEDTCTTDEDTENIIPDLVGKNLTDVFAKYGVKGGKLQFFVLSEYNTVYDKDVILSQSKPAGTPFDDGDYTFLTLTVSRGPENGSDKANVPDVTKMEYKAAESEIRSAGFETVIKEIADEEVPEGYVIRTYPAAGTKFELDDVIVLLVSNGKTASSETVTVPNVIGMTEDEALPLLKETGLSVKVEDILNSAEKGTVVDQDIEPDTTLNKYDDVTIYVSTGMTDPVEMTLSLPMPTGLRGNYRIDVYTEDGSVKTTKSINAAKLGETNELILDLEGYGAEKLSINIKSIDSGKSVDYAEFNIDYTNRTAGLIQIKDKDELLALNPAE
jgi:beta-lactam-binding protein with PASTA domain